MGIEKERVMKIRTHLRAGGENLNHSEALRVRTAAKAGTGWSNNHSERLERHGDREAISMRRTLLTISRKEDRLELLVVRAGLRAGRRRRGWHFALGRKR